MTDGLRTKDAPGAWLRACAVAVAVAAMLAVVSGATGLGTAHRVVAALAAPPLAALLVAALLSHRNLIAPVAVTGALLAAAAVAPPGPAHLALAAPALAAALRPRRRDVPRPPRSRRLVARLRDADEAPHHDPAPPDRPLRSCGRRATAAHRRRSSRPSSSGSASRAAARRRSTTSSTATSTG